MTEVNILNIQIFPTQGITPTHTRHTLLKVTVMAEDAIKDHTTLHHKKADRTAVIAHATLAVYNVQSLDDSVLYSEPTHSAPPQHYKPDQV